MAAPSGAVVVCPDSFPHLEELRGQFSVLDFVNLCAGIDATILHPRFYPLELHDDQDDPLEAALLIEGVLTPIDDRQLAPASSTDQIAAWMANPLTDIWR